MALGEWLNLPGSSLVDSATSSDSGKLGGSDGSLKCCTVIVERHDVDKRCLHHVGHTNSVFCWKLNAPESEMCGTRHRGERVQLELGSILLLMNGKAQGRITPILECECIKKLDLDMVRNWVGNESEKKLPSSTWGEMFASARRLTKSMSSVEHDMLNEVLKFEAKMPAKMHAPSGRRGGFVLAD